MPILLLIFIIPYIIIKLFVGIVTAVGIFIWAIFKFFGGSKSKSKELLEAIEKELMEKDGSRKSMKKFQEFQDLVEKALRDEKFAQKAMKAAENDIQYLEKILKLY